MSTKFIMSRDINGYNGFGLPFAVNGEATILAAGVAQTFTAPEDYPNWIAIFSYSVGSTVLVDGLDTASVPTGAPSPSTAQINPVAREVQGGQSISIITADAGGAMVQVSYYVKDMYNN